LGILTLADSAGGNRLNPETLAALAGGCDTLLADPAVRVILLRSDGQTFSLGMDFSFVAGSEDVRERETTVNAYSDLLAALYRAPKPVVALVRGDVKAGGVGLVAACDVVVASSDASFELSEVLFGLVPSNVLPFLLSLRMPLFRARSLILTARRLCAEEARASFLVDEIFPADELEKGLRGVLRTLFRAAPHAVAETKRLTAALIGTSFEEGLALARRSLLDLVATPGVREAIAAFGEGETPPWFARFKPKNSLTEVAADE
jgi:enoyl-CoA hydratase/carnithine racemase